MNFVEPGPYIVGGVYTDQVSGLSMVVLEDGVFCPVPKPREKGDPDQQEDPITFDVEFFPAEPFPGEATSFRVTNIENVPDDVCLNTQTTVLTDFGDAGATYQTGGGQDSNANRAMGRVSSHVYESQGTYTVSVTLYVQGATPVTNTVTVSVANPVVTDDLYLDFGEVSGTPTFGFAPPAVGGVQHVTSAAQFAAINMRAPNKVFRVTFKDDETFTDVSNDLRADNTFIIQRSYHGTAEPLLTYSSLANPDQTLTSFNMGSDASRLVVKGLSADGRFDPVTGIGPAGLRNLFFSFGDISADRYVSVWRCKGRGMRNFYSGGSPSNGLGANTTYYRFVDNEFSDWADYGIQWFGPHVVPCLVGNKLHQNPLALQRSSQKANLPEGSDHGPTRIQHIRWGCDENNAKIGASGWSPLPPGYYVQPCNRYLTAEASQQAEWEMHIHRNKGVGSCFVSLGSVSAANKIKVPPAAVIITHNEMDTGRQGLGGFVELDCAGVYIADNLHYRANVYDFNQHGNYFISYREYGGTIDPPIYDGEIKAVHNTVFSDRSTSSGGNGEFEFFDNQALWPGTLDLTISSNLVHTANHTNGVDLQASLSRGDKFSVITGQGISENVTVGVTYFDLKLFTRSIPEYLGAVGVGVPAATPVPAPVSLVAPTIAELVAFPGEFGCIDIGSWANVAPDKYHLMEYQWLVDGVPLTDTTGRDVSGRTYADTNTAPILDLSGMDLTLVITMTNRSGVRVASVASNAITL